MTDTTAPDIDPDVLSSEEAIDLIQKAVNAARWMEEISQRLDRAIRAPKGRVADMAEGYIVTKRINDILEEGRKSTVGKVVQDASYKYIPERMLDEDMTTFTSATLGYRVSVSNRTTASILEGMKPAAFQWLRDNDLGELIQENVNSQTLSAQVKRLIEDENMEPPEDIFKVSIAPNVSLTKVKPKG